MAIEMMLLKAVVEPMKINPYRVQKTTQMKVALMGALSVGWTFAKKLEHGRPLSRENAQVRRPEVATQDTRTPEKLSKIQKVKTAHALL